MKDLILILGAIAGIYLTVCGAYQVHGRIDEARRERELKDCWAKWDPILAPPTLEASVGVVRGADYRIAMHWLCLGDE